jgi:steroid delta-isomerase-like uncharacterized protein
MADTQGIEKVARGIVAAHSASDWSGVKKSLAPNSVYEEYGTQRRIEGADATVGALQAWKTAFPDVQGVVDKALVAGDTAALEVTWRGTHTGPLVTATGTLPASGKGFVLVTAWTMDVQGGQIQNSRHYFDILTLLQQIGAAPA